MKIIVAVDGNWNIGYNNNLLFHISEDMKRFKEITNNNIVVMGRKTFESLPSKEGLKNRINVIMSTHNNIDYINSNNNVIIVNSIDEFKHNVYDRYKDIYDIFIIGGSSIYKEFLKYCDAAYVTEISETFKADRVFPNLKNMSSWIKKSESELYYDIKTHLHYKFVVYENINIIKL